MAQIAAKYGVLASTKFGVRGRPDKRQIQINYPGTNNFSQLTVDGFGRTVKIVETVSGVITSTNQFMWCDNQMCESRNAIGLVAAQFFNLGETISGTIYLYTKDQPLGSVREMTDSLGNVQAEYSYDPYGRVTQLHGSLASDFRYAGYYLHAPSGLNLTLNRAYSSILGRWINRDPIGEDGGLDLYAYVGNMPTEITDPTGLDVFVVTSPGFGGIGGAQHVFGYGTDAGLGAGRGGESGSNSGKIGYPVDYSPTNPKYINYPKNKVTPNPDGTYGSKHMTESQFINFLNSSKGGLNDGPFVPFLNDCHNSLQRGFKKGGVPYPGSPLGRFGYIPPPPPMPFPPSSFLKME